MAKYKVLRDTESSKGAKFFKDEIVEGTPNANLKRFVTVNRANTWGDNKNDLILGNDIVQVDDATPISSPTQIADLTKEATKSDRTITILSSLGALAGLYYAFKKKKGVGGYIGFMILGGVAGSLSGHLINKVITKK
jgi:hypothetical protein